MRINKFPLQITSIICFGISALISQILLIRQFLENFWGNEIAIAISLTGWLIGAAFGSIVLGRLIQKYILNDIAIGLFQLAIAAAIPSAFFLCRIIKTLFGLPFYQVPSPLWMILSIQFILIPIGILFGFGFVLFCRAMGNTNSGKVYMLEAIGSFIGGTIFSFVLIEILNPIQIVSAIVLINSTLSFFSLNQAKFKFKICTLFVLITLLTLSSILLLPQPSDKLNMALARLQWNKQDVIQYKNSRYGNITVLKTQREFSVYENGSLFYNTAFTQANEELIHLILLEHPNPKRILLLGGGVGGLIAEILKHDIESLDYIEFDPLLLRLTKGILSENNKLSLLDKRVRIHYGDGIFFIRNAKPRSFDVVIVNLSDPSTLLLNRFYTKEFFKKASDTLNSDGILFVGISSKADLISKEVAIFNNSVYKTLREIFQDVIVIPGERAYFLASKNNNTLTYNVQTLTERFKQRNIHTLFFTEYDIQDKLFPGRIKYILGNMKSIDTSTNENLDFHPSSFYYNMALWWLRFYPGAASFFQCLMNLKPPILYLCTLLLLTVLFLLNKLFTKKVDSTILAIFTTGFTGISLELIIVIAFQAVYGYLYSRLSFIIASFMIGAALAALVSNRLITAKPSLLLRRLLASDVLVLIYIITLPAVLALTKNITQQYTSEIIFPVITILAGGMVGFQFPIANAIRITYSDEHLNTPGILYGMDLLGASLAALLLMTIIFPVAGLSGTIVLLALLKLVSVIVIMVQKNLAK